MLVTFNEVLIRGTCTAYANIPHPVWCNACDGTGYVQRWVNISTLLKTGTSFVRTIQEKVDSLG